MSYIELSFHDDLCNDYASVICANVM